MKSVQYECIILAGGKGLRLKPHTPVPKPMLRLNGDTLLSYQIKWLRRYGFKNIVVAIDNDTYTKYKRELVRYKLPIKSKMYVGHTTTYSIELEHLGTSGAIKKSVEYINSNQFYVMNVDDIVLQYNPKRLFNIAGDKCAVLLAKPRLRFGRVYGKNGYVYKFQQKPVLDFWVSCGHYVFNKDIVNKYFTRRGNFERTCFQRLVNNQLLKYLEHTGLWFTINTLKDLLHIKQLRVIM